MPVMSEAKERAIFELQELLVRIKALDNFVVQRHYSLSEETTDLLLMQKQVMEAYSSILRRRIKIWIEL